MRFLHGTGGFLDVVGGYIRRILADIGLDNPRRKAQAEQTFQNIARIVQKPHPTENKAKKVANRSLLIPRMVFENGELWGHLKKNAQISNETR